jgi:hypothetical protein
VYNDSNKKKAIKHEPM